jgi:Secretion system C-terminal sorting domain
VKTLLSVALLSMILTLFTISSVAQPRDMLWNQTFGGDGTDYGMCIDQTTDGGFIVVGATFSFGEGLSDVWLIKTDSGGNEQWSTTFGGGGYDNGYGVQQTDDGGYIVVAQTSSFGPQGYDVWLIKTDANGIEEWSETYNHNHNDFAYAVQQTGDGGYIITGYLIDGNDDWDVYLIKTDSGGEETWWYTYGGDQRDYATSVKQANDGGYIISGTTQSFGEGIWNLLLMKTDSDGNELWMHAFGGVGSQNGWEVQQTSDEGYIVTGWTQSFGAGLHDVWLIKTDSGGNESWNQTYGGIESDQGFSVDQTSDGGYVIAGYTRTLGDDDLWVIRTDSGGGETWTQRFGGVGGEYGQRIVQGTDGLYYVTGSTSSFGVGSDDLWLICLDDNAPQGVTAGDEFIPIEYRIEDIYPNPFNPTTTISIGLPSPSDLRVSVFNTVGQEIAVLADGQFAQGNQRFTFDATGLSTGIYFVQATVPGKMNQMRKVVYLK